MGLGSCCSTWLQIGETFGTPSENVEFPCLSQPVLVCVCCARSQAKFKILGLRGVVLIQGAAAAGRSYGQTQNTAGKRDVVLTMLRMWASSELSIHARSICGACSPQVGDCKWLRRPKTSCGHASIADRPWIAGNRLKLRLIVSG